MQYTQTSLINHISRLEGQIAAIKNELKSSNPDCEKAARTLKAASRSFSSLRLAFIACFLEKKYVSVKNAGESTYASLMDLVNA